MSNMLHGSTFFCMAISLFGYEAGIFLRKKLKIGIFNPLLVSIVFVIIVLKVTGIDYDTYDKGANVLSYLLTPSTVCLAIPLYQQMNLLKKNLKAIIAGITTGVFQPCRCMGIFYVVPPEEAVLCNASSKINYHSDRYGNLRRAWWNCDDYSCSDRNYRDYWKYVCRGNL